jgi:hypothetical protein
MTKVDTYYHRYAYLADYYAKKVWDTNNIGMELDDIKQELRIKLFLAIKTYAKKWGEYKRSGRVKPMPIEFYLKTVMLNKVRDFIKEINKVEYCDLEHVYDLKVSQEIFEISRTEIKVGFQNLTDLFEDKKQKRFMKLFFIHNFDVKKVFPFGTSKTKKDKEIEVKNLVDDGLLKIRKYLEVEN